jgi:hypothetical protein
MLIRLSRASGWFKILFIAVYVILFAVQLHLKYSVATTCRIAIDLDAMSAAPYHPPFYSQSNQFRQEFVGDKMNIKVSKRYQHKTGYEFLDVSFTAAIKTTLTTPDITLIAPGPVKVAPILYQHRGPPATC